jgi:hypothetical protein
MKWLKCVFGLSVLGIAGAAGLFGQAIIEDYKCSSSTSVASGNPTVITCPGPHGIRLDIPAYFVHISGATGAWSGLNTSPDIPWTTTIVDSNHIAVPFNSTGLPAFTGQITIRRASGDGNYLAQAYAAEDWSNSGAPDGESGFFKLNVRGCPTRSDGNTCSYGYELPDNGKQQVMVDNISGVTVGASGIATVSLAAPFPDNGPVFTLAPGAMIWTVDIGGLCAGAPTYPHVSSIDNYCFHQVLTVSANKTSFTYQSSLAAGTYPAVAGHTPYVAMTQPTRPYFYLIGRASGGYPYPQGFIHNHVKSGTFVPTMNRVSFYVKWGRDGKWPNGVQNASLGTFARGAADTDSGSLGAHWYHYGSIGSYAGQWMKVESNLTPTYAVGTDPNYNWPSDPTYNGWIYSPWPGGPRHYFDALTPIYWEASWPDAPNSTDTSVYYSPWQFSTALNEPEEEVQLRALQWAPSRDTLNTPGYELYWWTPGNFAGSYEVRYSTTGSLKGQGFSHGICKNGTTTCDSNDTVPGGQSLYAGLRWQSSSMALQPNIWVGMRPTVPVSGVSGAGQSPIWMITRNDLNLTTVDHVKVTGVGGNTAANQSAAGITAVQPRQTWWRDGANSYLQSIVSDGAGATASCTVHLTVGHNLVPGWRIQVWGTTDSTLGTNSEYSWYTVTRVIDPNTFVFGCPNVPGGTYNTDLSSGVLLAVEAWPGVAIAGTGNGTYTSGGMIVSTDDTRNFTEITFAVPTGSTSGTVSKCDVNGDGVVNSVDVDLAIQQALGNSPCTTADIDSDGRCDVVDVQRIVNATITGVCRTQ